MMENKFVNELETSLQGHLNIENEYGKDQTDDIQCKAK